MEWLSWIILRWRYATLEGEITLGAHLVSDYADQRLPEGHLDDGCVAVRIKLPPLFATAVLSTLDHFSHFLLCPPFSRLSPFLRISTKSDRISEHLKTPWTSKCQNQGFFFSFFSKDRPGQQALAQVGMHWHMLAHIGKIVVSTQWLPSHWGLPKKLQMTALSFSAPISLSTPLYFTLLRPLSFSLSTLSLFISLPLLLSIHCLYLLLGVC